MRLGKQDKAVLDAFGDGRTASSKQLTTDGKRLDGAWMGGRGIAEWTPDGIVEHDLGSKAAQQVQRALRKMTPEGHYADAKPVKRPKTPRRPAGQPMSYDESVARKRDPKLQRIYAEHVFWLLNHRGARDKAAVDASEKSAKKAGVDAWGLNVGQMEHGRLRFAELAGKHGFDLDDVMSEIAESVTSAERSAYLHFRPHAKSRVKPASDMQTQIEREQKLIANLRSRK